MYHCAEGKKNYILCAMCYRRASLSLDFCKPHFEFPASGLAFVSQEHDLKFCKNRRKYALSYSLHMFLIFICNKFSKFMFRITRFVSTVGIWWWKQKKNNLFSVDKLWFINYRNIISKENDLKLQINIIYLIRNL